VTQEHEMIEIAFKSKLIDYFKAVQNLEQKCSLSPREAEAIVEGWEGDIAQANMNAAKRGA
jgi:hypothetical protein